jgi:PAS domain S-box-containing protein
MAGHPNRGRSRPRPGPPGVLARLGATAWAPHGVALLAVVGAALLGWALGDVGPGAGVIPFFLALAVAAWSGGLGPTLAALGLSVPILVGWTAPRGASAIDLAQPAGRVALALYLMAGLAMALLGGSMHRAWREAQGAARALARRGDRLAREIDERRLAQRAVEALLAEQSRLREQAERHAATLAQLFEQAPLGLTLLDPDLRITHINPPSASYCGGTPAGLAGRELGAVLRDALPDAEAGAVEASFREVLRTGEPRDVRGWSGDLRHRDGAPFHSDWSLRRVEGPEGTVLGVLLTVVDVTDHLLRERALERSEERFRLAAEAVNGLIYEVDLAAGRTERSRGLFELVGFRPEEVPPSWDWWRSRMLPEDGEAADASYGRQLAAGDRYEVEYRARHRDGRVLHLVDRGVVSRDAAGTVVRLVGCTQDISGIREAEAALRRSEARFRGLFESNVVALSFFHADGRITDANDAYLEVVGHTREELRRGEVRWDRLTPPEHLGRDARALEALRRDGRCEPFEKDYVLADGRRLPVLIGGSLLPGSDAEGVGFLLDLSERKRAEAADAALRRAEERFRVAQELSPDGFTILRAVRDDSGAIVDFAWDYANPAAARMLRARPEELVGHSLLARLPGNRTASDLFARYVRVVEAGEPHDVELRYEADGLAGWFRNTAVPLGDGVAVSFADITETKRLQQEQDRLLRELEGRHRFIETLFRQVPAGILVADAATGDLILSNAEADRLARHDYQPGTALTAPEHRPPMRGTRPDGTAYAPADWPLARALRGEVVADEEIDLSWDDGTRRTLRANAAPVRGADGAVLAAVTAFHDITDRRQLEADLRRHAAEQAEAARRADEFLATLAHELRNPLAPIRHAVRFLKEQGPPEPELMWARDVIDRQVAQMARLLEDLLDVSRITRNSLVLRREVVPLGDVIAAAVETSRPLIDAAGHALEVRLPAGPVLLDGDPTRLAQVFANLLNNAAKYTPDGGHLALEATADDREVTIAVRDDGIGIAAEHLGRVFEMFSQVTPALERAQGGLGIGLATVRGLVELHGGRVAAESAGPGRGTTVRVTLPRRDAPPPEAAGPARAAPAGPAGALVLVVDDLVDSAHGVARLLRLKGYRVEVAHDGPGALAAAERLRPDAVLLDIGLPGQNGYEVARAIRAEPWGRGLVLVALTGWGQDADRRRSREAGFDRHLVKPVDPDHLLRSLAEALAGSARA